MKNLIKKVLTYEYDEDGNESVTKSTETYEISSESELNAFLEECKNSEDFTLAGHTRKFHPAKYKKEECIKDEFYAFTVKKEFGTL